MQITTERLSIREFVANDWLAVLAYQRDERYFQFYPQSGRSESEAQDFVEMFLQQQTEKPRRKFQLAITFQGDDQVIGSCGIRRKSENDFEADIGFELAPKLWGQGLATEAAHAMVNYGFTELKLHRISARCIAENTASVRVLEKVGLRPEGQMRDHEHFKDRWWDTLFFGMLVDDWKNT